MDNHPIPQDVTGFQFKLIGNMTIKQFAYLATGVILAWVLLQLPITFFIKFPISLIVAILGISLAYLPIEGRPLDLMIGNFIKALFRPTQFVYGKIGGQLYFPHTGTYPTAKKTTYSNDLPTSQNEKLKIFLQSMNTAPTLATHTAPSFKPNVPKPASVQPTIQPKPQANVPLQKPSSPPPLAKPLPRGIGQNPGVLSTPEFPNLITGITKDPRDNALSNILIEIKDREGNPVRAFKTNEIGRFASATPLANGTYTIELEDPKGQNKFEPKTINVTGQIILPLEIMSIDTREELRRSLFKT